MNLPPSAPLTPMDWTAEARCAQTGTPDAWFPEPGQSVIDAKRICRSCPVADICLQTALDNDEQYGVWGGLSPNERKAIKRGDPPKEPRRNARRKVQIEDIEFLLSVDREVTVDWLADRFGVKRDTVQAALRRAERWDLMGQLRRNERAIA